MRTEFKDLRRKQLDRSLSAFADARRETRPSQGWLRAVREALGLSLEEVAHKLGKVDRRRVLEFEEGEANDRITLRSLKRVADAMGCELVYAIVPKSGTLTELAEARARDQATEDVLDVENTMALENQAPGNVEELIEDETKRRLKKS
jgi:predicted DNA-binding mobile mystery protein A